MLLHELSRKASTYLGYHNNLNTKFWDNDQLNSEVYNALVRIAKAFIETLKVSENQQIIDIIMTGSLCNYNYTKYSDIDLHIILDYSELCDDCQSFDIDDCMKAKKALWNERHDITIYNRDVELYAQDKSEKLTGNAGIYSILHKQWVRRPTKEESIDYGDKAIMDKAKHIMYQIDELVDGKSDDEDAIEALKDKIKNMRKAGLERAGEFSIENLAFKILRNTGYIAKLHDYALEATDDSLSLE